MPVNRGMFSSTSDEWATPPALFKMLDMDFGPFDYDVAASNENHLCNKYYTKKENGLIQDWNLDGYNFFMNPPYGRTIGLWVEKAYQESLKGCLVCCLLPARTDTRWFHNFILPYSRFWFLRGRLRFGGAKNCAPFPSMIAVFQKFHFLED